MKQQHVELQMGKPLTVKQERFCLNLFSGMAQRIAYLDAGYASNSKMIIVDANASRLAKTEKVQARLEELRLKVERAAIGTKVEREKRLTTIYRADITDFIDSDGEPKLSKEIPNHGAVSEYTKTTRYTKAGDEIVTKSIKLRDPVSAIQEHNKMDGAYPTVDTPSVSVTVNNTQVNAVKVELDGDTLKDITRILGEVGAVRLAANEEPANPHDEVHPS